MLAIAGSAAAQTISWNQDILGTIGVEDSAGVSPASYWNNSFPEDSVTNLFDSFGAGTTLDIAPSAPFTYQILNAQQGPDGDGTSNKRLLNGYLNAGASSTPAVSSVELSQIPYASYNLYVYFSSDVAGRTGSVSVGATTYNFNTVGTPSVSGANALFAAATGATTTADAANYAVFAGLSGASQLLTVDIPDFGGIAGFQIVNTGAATAPFQWISTLDNQSYSTGSNWFGGVAPNPAVASDVVFGAQIDGNKNVVLNVSPTFNRLNFNNSLGGEPDDGDYFLVPATNQTITLAGAAEVYASGRHWLRAEVKGTSGLKATGPGQLILDAVNTFSGGLTVEGGSVAVVRDGALPTTNNITIQNGGDLGFWGVTNGFFVGTSGAPGFGTGTVSGNVTFTGGLLTVNDSANLTLSGAVTGPGSIVLGGVASGGLLTLSNANNTFTGQTRLFSDSVLTINSGSSIGTSDGTEANGTFLSQQGQLVLNGAALGNEYLFLDGTTATQPAKIVSQGASSISGNIFASAFGGPQFEISSSAGSTLSLTGTLSAADDVPGSTRSYVFSGAGNFSVAKISDAAVNGDGVVTGPSTGDNVTVVKRGAGTMTLTTATSAANDFWRKSTVVEQGTLKVESNGAGVGELQSKIIDVKQGGTLDVTAWQDDSGSPAYNLGVAQTLSGGGTVNAGTATLGIFGDNIVSPGDGIGTLSVMGNARLTISNSATGGALNFQLGNTTTVGGGVNDLIAVTGTLTTVPSGSGTMSVNAAFDKHAVAAGGNVYTVMTFASSAPSLTGLVLKPTDSKGNAITSRSGTGFSLVANSTSLQVQVTGNTIGSRTWTGAASGAWTKGATGNWSGGDNQFFDFDSVTFGAAATNKNVTLAATVSPGAMTINGGSYTFSGAAISAPSVSVTGASTVASFANTLGGDVTVSSGATLAGAGTLQDDVTVQSDSKLRIGGANLAGGGAQRVVSWNVDNNGTIGGDGAGSLPPLGALAGVVSVGGWSNTFPDNPTTNLRDDLGDATTLDIAPFSNSGTWNVNNFAHAGQDANGTWNKELLTGYLNSGSPNGSGGAGVVISQIPYGAYDIYVYFNSDNDTRTGTVSNGTTTYSFKAAGAAGSFGGDGNATFHQATALTTTADTANYAVFSNLTGVSQTLTVNIPDFGGLAGFQVVRSASALVGETMSVLGDVSLESGATTVFNIGTSGVSDRLDIGGNLALVTGSILQVVLDGSVSSSSLVAGDTWDLFDFASASGTFNQADFLLPTLAAGLSWNTSNLLIDGTLSVALAGLPGDYNGDGIVDAVDYTVWRNNLGGDESALAAGSRDPMNTGPIDGDDYTFWKNHYGESNLGGGGLASVVPEPGTIGLVLLALGFISGRGARVLKIRPQPPTQ